MAAAGMHNASPGAEALPHGVGRRLGGELLEPDGAVEDLGLDPNGGDGAVKQAPLSFLGRMCVHSGCAKVPSFGPPGPGGAARRCKAHKLRGEMDLRSRGKLCCVAGCEKQSSFGTAEHGARYCATHCDRTVHADLKNRACQNPPCSSRASFGPKDTRARLWCSRHRAPTDTNNRHKRCEREGCLLEAAYGPMTGTGRPVAAAFCRAHCDLDTHLDRSPGRDFEEAVKAAREVLRCERREGKEELIEAALIQGCSAAGSTCGSAREK
ncbi:hypothetical protein T484DRAFT_1798958 [Baffinella frigidus]|nr:hypothetical protein T484DRAFT_1798958 [Cryptophyta sp. CCMP2293]